MPSDADLVVIGAGVVGLWCAIKAADAGLSVCIVHDPHANPPASAGLVGALMAHHPGEWSEKKAVQLRGLSTLPALLETLSDETGLPHSWRKTGRAMPLRTSDDLDRHRHWEAGAETHWRDVGARWIAEAEAPDPGWAGPAPDLSGWALDTLAARASPRIVLALLREAAHQRTVKFVADGVVVQSDGKPSLATGRALGDMPTIVAAGYRSFALADAISRNAVSGTGVKGQAARFRPRQPVNPDWPILFDRGLYVIAHDDGSVIVGSTSENQWADPQSTDDQLDALIDRAKTLSPALADAECVERWAGIRPKAASREPVVGRIGQTGTVIATGGFKISFAVAHLMADVALAECLGEPAPDWWPESFRTA